MVNEPGVTLENVTINGDLIIGDGVGDGEVTLDNVNVTGRMVVRGGGENSIIIKGNSTVSNMIVARLDGVVSVKVQGDANVEIIYVDDGSDDVNVQGSVGGIEVVAPGVTVHAVDATIRDVSVSGENSKVVVDSCSSVEMIDIKAAATNAKIEVAGTVTTITTSAEGSEITGTGDVAQVTVQSGASHSKINTPHTKIMVSAGVTGVTGGGGAAINAGTSATNNSEGSDLVKPLAPPVVIRDTTAPIITLQGNATEAVAYGGSYTDAGATAADDRDGDLTQKIVVTISNNVNAGTTFDSSAAGTYTYHYNVQDAAGNKAVEVTRKVIVAPADAPVISNIHMTSSNADSTIAKIGDTITLTFSANEPVEKLSNFKINGSNPDTFTHVGNDYTATHLVDVGDLVTW